MKEELISLLELSDFDKKAYDLRKSNKDLPIKINELKSGIQKAEPEDDLKEYELKEDELESIEEDEELMDDVNLMEGM